MPTKIVYQSPEDATAFDIDKFVEDLNSYGGEKVTKEEAQQAIEEYGNYDPLHVSCLVSIGITLIKDEDAAKRYYEDNAKWISNAPNFERLRRITGYLVGSLERWNDGKKAEEKARVKHNVSGYDNAHGQFSKDQKDNIEAAKYENSVMSQF